MTPSAAFRCSTSTAALALCTVAAFGAPDPLPDVPAAIYAETLDAHWKRLRDGGPYFEL